MEKDKDLFSECENESLNEDFGNFQNRVDKLSVLHGGLEYAILTKKQRYVITAEDYRRIGEDILRVGTLLSDEDVKDLAYSHQKLLCIQKALNHLSYVAMSEKKLRGKLFGKFSPYIIDDALEILKANGCVNDFELAYALCEEYYYNGQIGPLKIKAKLYQRQFSAETVNEVFESFEFDEESMWDNMEKLIGRKFGDLTKKEDKGKAIEYLVRCGYPFDEAKSFVITNEW